MTKKSLEDVDNFIFELNDELDFYQDKREVLEAIIEYGKQLEELVENLRTEDNKVKGCISGVNIIVKENDGRMHFEAHSESMIVKGYVFLVISAFEGLKKLDLGVACDKFEEFAKEAKLTESMISSRANAIGNIIRYIKEKAGIDNNTNNTNMKKETDEEEKEEEEAFNE